MREYVPDDRRIISQAGFGENAGAVRTGRLHAQVQDARDLGDGIAGAEEPEDLEFAIAQTLVRQCLAPGASKVGRNRLGDRRAHITSSGGNPANRLDQLLRGAFLLHISERARAQRANRKQLLGMHAENEHAQMRKFAFDVFEQLDSVAVSQGHIEHDDIERPRPKQCQQLVAGSGFPGHGEVGCIGQNLAQTLSNDCMIVRNGNPDHRAHPAAKEIRRRAGQAQDDNATAKPESSMPSRPKFRLAISYAIAVAVPIVIAVNWQALDPLVRTVPGYLSLLFVALVARLIGFRAAIASTATIAVILWFYALPALFPEQPVEFKAIRVMLVVFTAAVLASISRQRSVEVSAAEERCRIIVDTSPDGIVVSDERGTILFVNPALTQLVAADAQDLIGGNAMELAHAPSRSLLQKSISDIAATGSMPATEMTWITRGGRQLDVELVGVRVQKSGQDVVQMFVRDHTQRRRTEARLDETARRMTALFDAAFDAILWVDSNGTYVDANPAASRLLGYTHEEMLSKRIGAFTPLGEKEEVERIWREARTGGSRRGEFRIVRKDGEIREIEYVTAVDVLPGFHCAFMHDITARKEAERSVQRLSARLLQLQDEERRRIARQLHETTAQNLVAMKLNLVRMRRLFGSGMAAVDELLEESIALNDQSIGEIRTLAYLLHPPMIEEAGLVPSLRWYAKGFETRSGIPVALDFPEELSRLPPEMETALFRIVQEALINIQRHSGSAVARIRLERRANAIEMLIEDEGRGMPPPLRDDDTLLAASGVGIAGIRERVRELGGRMNIESRDGGMLLSVTLPLQELRA